MKFIYQNCFLVSIIVFFSCHGNHSIPTKEQLSKLNLKRGEVIACGPPGKEFGKVDFKITGDASVNSDFNTGLELLHSFEYDEAEKGFCKDHR
jgi:hypothetical protein